MRADASALADLLAFGRVEVESRDVEPWADLIGQLRRQGTLGDEDAAWVVKLYNAYDDFGSAWSVFRRWPSVLAWATGPLNGEVAAYPVTNERRALRLRTPAGPSGKMVLHLASYSAHVANVGSEVAWLRAALAGDDPGVNFMRMVERMRLVWGVGRQSSFEWAEFVGKVGLVEVTAPEAYLWESEGPRRSLQRLYRNPTPTPEWLEDRAFECRDWLDANGLALSWEDFETIICDFNVMRDGRYYPGRHLAALREEIELAPEPDRPLLLAAWAEVVPAPWRSIAPGIDRGLLPVYRETGQIITPELAA